MKITKEEIMELTKAFLVVALTYVLIIYPVILKKESKYCDGWEKGYKAGWCYEIVNCIEPIVPVCPVPKPGLDTYEDGYNRGFTQGKKKRNE